MTVNPKLNTRKGKTNTPPPSSGFFDTLRAPYDRLDARTRMIIKVGLGCFLGVWAFAMIAIVFHNLGNPDGPYIFDAMKAPYTLESRWQPPLPDQNTNVMPSSVSDFALDLGHSTVATQGSAFSSTVSTQPGACLFSAIEGSDPTNCTGFNAEYVASGDFANPSGDKVNVVMAKFSRHDDAISVMKTFLAEARALGGVDKYVIGVTLVSYFSSAYNGAYNFYWSNGDWVYIASSASVQALDQLVTDFPF